MIHGLDMHAVDSTRYDILKVVVSQLDKAAMLHGLE
jgi:hypothetical protein